MVEQLAGGQAHHLAKSWIDVSDAASQIPRAQASSDRVFHCFAKGQRLAQILLRLQAAFCIACQKKKDAEQRQCHRTDHGRQHIGKQRWQAHPAFQPQHQRFAGQIEQLPCHEHTAAVQRRAQNRQPCAISFRERQALAPDQLLVDQFAQHLMQRIACHDKTCQLPSRHDRQAQVHHLHAQAVGLRQKVAV